MTSPDPELAAYLRPTPYIDSDHPDVFDYAESVAGGSATDVDKAVALYYSVRDTIRYDPYNVDLRPGAMRASAVLARKYGFCVPKAILLAAAARVEGIPSRLGFADVRNHLTTERLRRLMLTDVFVYHGYVDLFLRGKWVKATPAFNNSLCERFNVPPLEFDGIHDSLLQQVDRAGNRYMEYIRDHGHFADLPLKQMLSAFEEHYPSLMSRGGYVLSGDFPDETPRLG